METIFLGFVVFLFVLAVFDLMVGVSNDAVNFLNSAVGAKVARFRTIVIVASFGVFVGAVMSNGMMDIARHGIFRPEMYSFEDLMCIFLAVMVTDVVLLDIFNTLGCRHHGKDTGGVWSSLSARRRRGCCPSCACAPCMSASCLQGTRGRVPCTTMPW